jgi:hypothetical protein
MDCLHEYAHYAPTEIWVPTPTSSNLVVITCLAPRVVVGALHSLRSLGIACTVTKPYLWKHIVPSNPPDMFQPLREAQHHTEPRQHWGKVDVHSIVRLCSRTPCILFVLFLWHNHFLTCAGQMKIYNSNHYNWELTHIVFKYDKLGTSMLRKPLSSSPPQGSKIHLGKLF